MALKTVSCGVDWVSVSAPSDGRDHGLIRLGNAVVEAQSNAGSDAQKWRWNGYDGRAAEGVAYGLRPDGAYLRLSGQVAHDRWREAVSAANTITRLDVEVTVRPDPPDPAFAERVYRDGLRWARGRERAPEVKKVETQTHTETVYFGRRISDQSARVYDKYRESEREEWRDCWRYEVEARRSIAGRLARRLAHDPDPGGAVRLYLHSWFSRRGHRPGYGLADGDVRISREPHHPDTARRLAWLGDQVNAVTTGLIADGHGAAVLDRLSLTLPLVERLLRAPRKGDP